MAFVTEPEKKIKVSGKYDVVVVGGGIAGVSAAVAAAREGAKVALIEKENALGGLATLGLVVVYLPLCDGYGNKVTGGLAEELLKLSVKDGNAQIPAGWKAGGKKEDKLKNRYRVEYNASSLILELDNIIEKAGVKMMFDTRFCDVIKTDNRIDAVIIENKEGRSALKCKAVIDASGDADVCARSEEKTKNISTNVIAGWYSSYGKGKYTMHHLTRHLTADGMSVHKKSNCRGYSGIKADDVTELSIEARKDIAKHLKKFKKLNKNDEIYPILLPMIPCFRQTRRLESTAHLELKDDRKYFDDTIGVISNWRMKGPIYYIRYGAIAGQKIENLFAAGRCACAGNSGWDQLRVIPACAVTGQAAGIAATMLRRGKTVQNLDVKKLQEKLKKQKVILSEKFSKLPKYSELDKNAGNSH